MDNQIVVSDYAQMDRVLREERAYILNLVKQIKKAGCNVLLIQKSILRYVNSDLLAYCVCLGEQLEFFGIPGKLKPNTNSHTWQSVRLAVVATMPLESTSIVCILSLMTSLLCCLKNFSTASKKHATG